MGKTLPTINAFAPDFTEDAYMKDEIKRISLSDYRGKWLILFFYPADFTFICTTELGELADHYCAIRQEDADVISISVDTAFVHKAWHDSSETIRKIEFPMLADPARRVSTEYGTLIENEGLSLRATFLVDPNGILKAFEFHDNTIGRSIEELLRKLRAAKSVADHGGEVCPENWTPGAKTLKPGLELVGKI